MTTNLSVVSDNANQLMSFDPAKIEVIKKTVAKGATSDELAMFMHLCQTYQLDPFRKEIWFIKRGNDPTIMTSRDGYLKVAQTDSNFEGIQSFVVKEGDHFEIDAENSKVIHKFGVKRGKILGAWAVAYHTKRKPVICFVDYAEYNDERSPVWKKYPSAMIQKVAEVFVLKRQFGITGLVTQEELSLPQEQVPVIEEPKKLDKATVKIFENIMDGLEKTEKEFLEGLSQMLKTDIVSLHDLAQMPEENLIKLIDALGKAVDKKIAEKDGQAS